MKTKQIGPFLGLNNRLDDATLGTEAGRFLARCENVDIDDTGAPLRRRGVSRIAAMTGAHSLMMRTATAGFLVRDSVLYDITLPAYSETLLSVLGSNAAMSYEKLGHDWYFSNGTDAGRFSGGAVYPMGLPTPGAPACVTIPGDLTAGRFKVVLAYCNADTGEEGGMSEATQIDATGGVRVTLPGATSGATHVNVYLSDPNGGVALLHSSHATGTATADLTAAATGRAANVRFEQPLPAGSLFASNGRLCAFSGSMVYLGLPYRPGYYDPLGGYIPFTENVAIAIENQSGTYIVADKTYFVPGDLGNVQENIRDVLPYGAVPGTAFKVPNQPQVGWFSTHGFVLADTAGQIDTTMGERVKVTAPTFGAASVCECKGYRRVSGCGYSMNLANKAVSTYTDWAFTSLSKCFGTKADGIYKTDTDDAVDAVIGLGKLDFGDDRQKLMPAAYIGSEANLKMTITTGKGAFSYTAMAFDSGVTQRRITPGKGLVSNWFDVQIANIAGADFRIASLGFAPISTARRI